ncbi:MAG: hypothetical protein KJZ65_02990 [Phycisphaerales bacterium]|nr:hypothetical protein [Phycisphaerales bacterium]
MQTELIQAQDLIPLVAIVGGIAVAIIAIIAGTIRATCRTKEVETTRREMAAYVAEGSITPGDAERLLKASSQTESEC